MYVNTGCVAFQPHTARNKRLDINVSFLNWQIYLFGGRGEHTEEYFNVLDVNALQVEITAKRFVFHEGAKLVETYASRGIDVHGTEHFHELLGIFNVLPIPFQHEVF